VSALYFWRDRPLSEVVAEWKSDATWIALYLVQKVVPNTYEHDDCRRDHQLVSGFVAYHDANHETTDQEHDKKFHPEFCYSLNKCLPIEAGIADFALLSAAPSIVR